jgi:ABC-type multidrug transport system fused ATPase/permease subunit
MKDNLPCFQAIIKKTLLSTASKRVIVWVVIGSVLLAVSQITRSFMIGQLVEKLQLKYLYYYIAIFLVAYLINATQLFTLNRRVIGYKKTMFHHLLDTFYYAKHQDGEKHHATLLNDMNESMINVNMMTFSFLTNFLNRLCVVKLTVLVFIYYLPLVGLAMLVGIFMIFFCYAWCLQQLHQTWLRYWREYNHFNVAFQDIILNAWNVRYGNMRNYLKEKIQPYLDKRLSTFLSWLDKQVIVFELPAIMFFILMSIAIAYIVKTPSLTVGIRVFLIYTLYKAWLDLYQLCSQFTEVFKQSKYVAKICPAWNLPPQAPPFPKGDDSIQHIEFRNVNFRYSGHRTESVISNLSFSVHSGQIATIIAASGRGKSTVFNLLTRIYELEENTNDVDSGDIYLNKLSIREWNPYRIRNCVAVVPQQVAMFEGTVRENIVLDRNLIPERLQELLEICGLAGDAEAKKLSLGGQQRVLIARALYDRNKTVFLMDEYLSAVDPDRAGIIHRYTTDFIRQEGKIGIFISHDPEKQKEGDVIIKI